MCARDGEGTERGGGRAREGRRWRNACGGDGGVGEQQRGGATLGGAPDGLDGAVGEADGADVGRAGGAGGGLAQVAAVGGGGRDAEGGRGREGQHGVALEDATWRAERLEVVDAPQLGRDLIVAEPRLRGWGELER
jgi:hypothetical protein